MKSTIKEKIVDGLRLLKSASRSFANVTDAQIKEVLDTLAQATRDNCELILRENQKDLDRMDVKNPKYDRLLLTADRIGGIANDLANVANLPSPLGKEIEARTLDNGLELKKISVPMGTIGIVYESRPNVTFDVFALCLKSGNAVALKGSRDAHYSNTCIVEIINEVLQSFDLPKMVFLLPSEREALPFLLEAENLVDLIIPRGSQGLINFVRANAKIPVIETGAGIVHTYVHEDADIEKARAIITNAKTRRVSVCNALDCLLIHRDRISDLPHILLELDDRFGLVIHADKESFNILSGKYQKSLLLRATEESYGTEFLSMQLAVKMVSGLDEALDHIYTHSSKHSEAIISESKDVIERFFNEVDAAAIYANTSTAFTDGGQFGLGAEIGISTQKLHARGPMGLAELTSYKWIIKGDGQIRA